MKVKTIAMSLGVVGMLAAGAAGATTGYFAHGYGIKAKGMGGVGIALPQDALAAAINPAGMVMVGNRLDVGLEFFRPVRDAEIVGNAFPGVNGTYDGSGDDLFYIPEFGYNRMLSPNMSVGLTVYGNGGMNTRYERSPFTGFGGSSPAGVDLIQLFIAPSIAFKFAPDHALGVALNLAHQRFSIDGAEVFSGFSSDSVNFSNRGDDSSNGWGVRIGYTGQLTPSLTVGATYQSKTRMSEFDKYRGLFAEQGDFDIPANYGIGVAFKVTDALTIAADVLEIKYGDVKAIANPISNLFAGNLFGSANGPGFGWEDTTVFKLGVSYQLNKDWTVRAGYVKLDQPIPNSQTLLNIFAPGVVEDHVTLGATWNIAPNMEVSFSYMHAFEKTINGSGSIPAGNPPAGFGGGEANIKMHQDSIGFAFGWKM